MEPGDTVVVHAGPYRNDWLNFTDPMTTPFDGTHWLTIRATPERPITIWAAGDGQVVFDGTGNHRLFEVTAYAHHAFHGLTFRNTDIAIFAGFKNVDGAIGLTVRTCRFEDIGFGVWTEYEGPSDFYIADNAFPCLTTSLPQCVADTGRAGWHAYPTPQFHPVPDAAWLQWRFETCVREGSGSRQEAKSINDHRQFP